MRVAIALIPYAIVGVFAWLQAHFTALDRALIDHGPRHPVEATGQTWEIAYRGGAFRYATHEDYLMYYGMFAFVPLFMIAVVWILIDWHKAGLFEYFKR
jgi:hypothetical protein